MKKLAIVLLLLLLLTGCKKDNGAAKSQPSGYTSASTQEETIRIQPEKLLLSVGETASLVCQNASEQAVTDVIWAVEDERIATISSDGIVTAVTKGDTTALLQSGREPPVYRQTAISQSRNKKCWPPTGQR